MGFGARFNAATRGQLRAKATPPSGNAPEAIWWEYYDTQTYVDNTTLTLNFFQVTNVDRTITNMPSAGQLPDPQWLSIYDITCDFLVQNTSVAGAVGVTGVYNDLALLLMIGRPTWTLQISDKNYGPFSLTLLHGTGSPVGFIAANGTAAATEQHQLASNVLNPGWNYKGSLIIPPKTNFVITVNWSAAQNLTADVPVRLALHGILSRRTL